MNLKQGAGFVVLAATILSSGCATSALWEEGRFARFHEPATPSNLQLFHSGEREAVLVQYDESREGDESIRRRAYWLEPGEPVKNPHKARFVPVETSRGLLPIPLADSLDAAPLTNTRLYAIVGTNGVDFSLRSGERTIGMYDLPVYEDASGKTKQVLLTPVAVVADLTIIGGFLFLWAWSEGALSCLH